MMDAKVCFNRYSLLIKNRQSDHKAESASALFFIRFAKREKREYTKRFPGGVKLVMMSVERKPGISVKIK